jgi:hypothetical protein
MPKKQKSSRNKKKAATTRVVRKTVRSTTPVALATPRRIVRRRVLDVETPAPEVDTIVTETDFVTEPKVEVRRAATLSQALTEPAQVVVKPETKVVSRVVTAKRRKRVA